MTCGLSGQVRNACPFMVPVPKPPDSEQGAGTRWLRPAAAEEVPAQLRIAAGG